MENTRKGDRPLKYTGKGDRQLENADEIERLKIQEIRQNVRKYRKTR